MSRDGRTHRFPFFVAVATVAFLLVSAGVAWSEQNVCDTRTGGVKHWRVLPPGWECGAGGVELTE